MAPEGLAHGENGEDSFYDPVLIDFLIEDIEHLMEITSDLGLDLPLEREDVGVCSERVEGADIRLHHHPELLQVKIFV